MYIMLEMRKKCVNFNDDVLDEGQSSETSNETITLSSQSQEQGTSPSQLPPSTDQVLLLTVVSKLSKKSKLGMFKKSIRKASKIKRNGYILGVIGTTLKLEANYKCKDQKVYTVYQILDRWLSDKPDPVTNEHVHIGYTVLYENFLNEPWVLKLQDMTNYKDLIAEFERLNPIVQVKPTVFKTHSKDYS
jgi:hypothetical protein